MTFGKKRGCFVWPLRAFCYIKLNGSQTVRQDDGHHPPVAKFYVARHRERYSDWPLKRWVRGGEEINQLYLTIKTFLYIYCRNTFLRPWSGFSTPAY